MEPKPRTFAHLEIIWWVFTILVTIGVLFPIYNRIEDYPFYFINVVFIVAFITLTRYIFLLKFTFLAKLQLVKVALFFLSIPLIFYLIQELNFFQTYLDEEGLTGVVGNLPYQQQIGMISYIRNEILLFGVGSVISAVIFPFRLLISVWRLRNKGTV